jgi:hypothetical protein
MHVLDYIQPDYDFLLFRMEHLCEKCQNCVYGSKICDLERVSMAQHLGHSNALMQDSDAWAAISVGRYIA